VIAEQAGIAGARSGRPRLPLRVDGAFLLRFAPRTFDGSGASSA
jgi:hypothetical protein